MNTLINKIIPNQSPEDRMYRKNDFIHHLTIITDKELKENTAFMNNFSFETQLQYCREAIEENPDLVIHWDLEDGWPHLITKEQQAQMIAMWEAFKPKALFTLPLDKIMVFGVSAFYDIWADADKYIFANSERTFKSLWDTKGAKKEVTLESLANDFADTISQWTTKGK